MVLENLTPDAPKKPRLSSLVMFLCLLAVLLILNCWIVAPYLLTVLAGGILAVIVNPVYEKLRKRKWKPVPASTVVTLGLVCLIIVPVSLFALLAVREGVHISNEIASQKTLSLKQITRPIEHWAPLKAMWGDPEVRQKQIQDTIQGAGQSAAKFILGLVANLPGMTLQTIIASIACWFFLTDGGTFIAWVNNKVPLHPDVRIAVVESFKETAVSTLWSALSGAAVQAGLLVVAFLVTGVPAVFVAGGAAFILAWIPILGSIPVWVTGIIYLAVHGAAGKAFIVFALGIIAGILDNVVRTLTLKGRGDMHSLVALVSIFGGIDLFGILGVFYGPILMAVLLALLDAWPIVGKRYGIFFDSTVDIPGKV